MKKLETKIPPPVVTILFALLMWVLSSYLPVIELRTGLHLALYVMLIIGGVLFCIAGIIPFRRAKTTINPVNPELASSLISSGVYTISRNPMYVGFALFLLAWAVYLSSPWSAIGVFGFVLYINRFQILPEEKALKKIFNEQYANYQMKVRRWL